MRFDQLVSDLSSTLGPDSGHTTDGTNINRLTELMAEYLSQEGDWQRYAYVDSSRSYTRNLVDKSNGKYNLVRFTNVTQGVYVTCKSGVLQRDTAPPRLVAWEGQSYSRPC